MGFTLAQDLSMSHGMNDLWLAQAADCTADPDIVSTEKARFVLSIHAHVDWHPCLQRLGALAYLHDQQGEA